MKNPATVTRIVSVIRFTSTLLAAALITEQAKAVFSYRDDPDYLIETVDTVDGLLESSVVAMVQDREGYLWIATSRGLARWDGVATKIFDKSNTSALGINTVTALNQDTRGRLWAATPLGLAVLDGETWTTVTLPGPHDNRSPVGSVARTLTMGTGDAVLVSTFDGTLYQLRGNDVIALPPPSEKGTRNACGVDEAGNWWAISHRFIGKWDGQRWVATIPVEPGFTADGMGCGAARDGGLWILAGGILRRVRQGTEDSRTPVPDFTGVCNTIYEDSAGQVWISASLGGLWRVSPSGRAVRHWTNENGLPADSVGFTLEDKEHNLWVATQQGGLARFRERTFRTFLPVTDRAFLARYAITPWPGGGVLIAPFGRAPVLADTSGVTPFPLPATMAHLTQVIRSVLVDKSERLWVGTYSGGVWMQQGDTTRHFAADEAGGADVSTLFEDPAGRIWMAGRDSVAVFSGDTVKKFGAAEGLPPGVVSSITTDRSGSVWLAHSQGLFRFEDGRMVEVKEAGDSIRVSSLLGDADGGVWTGSFQLGLRLWKNGKLQRWPMPPDLSVGGIRSLAGDEAGFLWMTTSQGILRAPLAELRSWMADGSPVPAFRMFGTEHGLPGLQFTGASQSAAARDLQGRLWFPLGKGVAMADPAALHLIDVPPPVCIQSVTHFGASAQGYGGPRDRGTAPDVETALLPPFAGEVSFPPGSRRLEISYAALSYAAPQKVHYQVSLMPAGGGVSWQEAAGQRNATYYDLPPGSYTFRVRAANHNGVWNQSGAALAFTLQPHYWQTGWFRAAGVLTLLAMGAGVTWWIMRFRHARVSEKLALQQQRGELAHLGRVASMSELSGSLAHELNQPLAAILSNAQAAQRFMDQSPPDLAEVREILTDIVSEDRRAGEVIRRMRGMLKKEKPVLQFVPLNEMAEEVLGMIRSDLVARNVHVSLEPAPGLPPAFGDRIQFQQVILNLLINACDAMSDTPVARRSVTISTAADHEHIRLCVRDQGHGLEPGTEEKVFEPFHTTKAGGLGMGLAICRSIITAYGGRLTATNHAGGGAVFCVELPLNQEPPHD